jgi:hypothetical protein
MTQVELEAILKELSAKVEKDGFWTMPEGTHLTLHVAHGGASLAISRIEALRVEGSLVYTRTPRREMHACSREDVYAIGSDGGGAQQARRPGFG